MEETNINCALETNSRLYYLCVNDYLLDDDLILALLLSVSNYSAASTNT